MRLPPYAHTPAQSTTSSFHTCLPFHSPASATFLCACILHMCGFCTPALPFGCSQPTSFENKHIDIIHLAHTALPSKPHAHPSIFFPKGLILKQGSRPTWVCCSWDLPWPGSSELALGCCILWWFNSITAHHLYLIPFVLCWHALLLGPMNLLLYTIPLLQHLNLMLNTFIIFLFQTRTLASYSYPCIYVHLPPPILSSSPTLHASPITPLHTPHASQADKGKDHVHASDASLHPEWPFPHH
jgi:hypothetical protein